MGISVWQILIVLVIVILLFGTKKLRNLGGDLGEAVKGFKKGIQEDGSTGSEVSSGITASIEHCETQNQGTATPEYTQQGA